MRRTDYEGQLRRQLELLGVSAETEYRFHPKRKWRFDLALPLMFLAVEVEGAVWTSGRHTRGSGFVKDMEKYNEAAKLGWRILRFTPQQVKDLSAAQEVASLALGREVQFG